MFVYGVKVFIHGVIVETWYLLCYCDALGGRISCFFYVDTVCGKRLEIGLEGRVKKYFEKTIL